MFAFTVLLFVCGFATVFAETHTIKFDNRCGYGTPVLIQGPNTMKLVDDSHTIDGVFASAIAYLQTGSCLFNGEKCTTVEMTLGNPTCIGCGSSTDISLIPPHNFSVSTSFSYYGGCDGQGASCSSSDCSTAFFKPDDNQVQVACQDDNVNLLITFCGDESPPHTSTSSTSSHSQSSRQATATSSASRASASVRSSSAPLVLRPSSTVPATGSMSTAAVNRKFCKNAVPKEGIRAHKRRRGFMS